MAKVEKFEDLEVWQRARKLVKKVYDILEKFPKSEQFNLVDQAKRAVVSAPANISEGFSRYHLQESVYFYRNSRSSLSELKSHFYVSFDLKYIDNSILDEITKEIDVINRIVNGLISSTRIHRTKP